MCFSNATIVMTLLYGVRSSCERIQTCGEKERRLWNLKGMPSTFSSIPYELYSLGLGTVFPQSTLTYVKWGQ